MKAEVSEILRNPSLLVYAAFHPRMRQIKRERWFRERQWMLELFPRWEPKQIQGLVWSEFSRQLVETSGAFELEHRAGAYYVALFLVARWKMPHTAVETGVFYGFSSFAILTGMRQGVLHSIDLPMKDVDVGAAVQGSYRDSWDLRLGDARVLLPKLVSELGGIDLFLHDSLHTYEHMTFEFETVYPHLKEEDLLIADDIDNGSFSDFCQSVGMRNIILDKTANKSKFGIAIKGVG